MSLTGLLRNRSWLRTFFQTHFPYTRDLVAATNNDIAPRPILGVPNLTNGQRSLVGTAFDYRVRACFKAFDPWKTVAVRGCRNVLLELGAAEQDVQLILGVERPRARPRGLPAAAWRCAEFFRDCCDELNRLAPNAADLSARQNDRLDRAAMGLAYFEPFYRAPGWIELGTTPLGRALRRRSVERVHDDLTGRGAPEVRDDLRAIVAPFVEDWWRSFFRARGVVLNPTFAGSASVGGADADIIIRGALIELKTTARPRPLQGQDLWQLLGYVLLDHDDEHEIKSVGVYFARRRWFRHWTVDLMLRKLMGVRWRPVADCRALLRKSAAQARARAEEELERLFASLPEHRKHQ